MPQRTEPVKLGHYHDVSALAEIVARFNGVAASAMAARMMLNFRTPVAAEWFARDLMNLRDKEVAS